MIPIMAVWDYPGGPRLVREWIRPGDIRRVCPSDRADARTLVTVAGRGYLFSPEPAENIIQRINGARRAPHFQPRIAR